jgi:nucleoid DNA-binding protein
MKTTNNTRNTNTVASNVKLTSQPSKKQYNHSDLVKLTYTQCKDIMPNITYADCQKVLHQYYEVVTQLLLKGISIKVLENLLKLNVKYKPERTFQSIEPATNGQKQYVISQPKLGLNCKVPPKAEFMTKLNNNMKEIMKNNPSLDPKNTQTASTRKSSTSRKTNATATSKTSSSSSNSKKK